MALVTLEEAKIYLRVDSADEDAMTGVEKWESVNSDEEDASLTPIRETMKVAILYALGYLFEHREEADHHALTLTLRSILFAIREGVV